MFFQKKKGSFPYLKKVPVYQGLFTLLLLILPVGLFFIGYFNFKDVKNLFTVAAVVGMLPAAKSIVQFIMYLRAEKYSCPDSLHRKIQPLEGKGAIIGYDYYLTSYSVNYPIPAAAVGKGVLIGLCTDSKVKIGDCENHLKEYLKKNELSDIGVKIFDSEEKFLKRITELSESKDELTSKEKQAYLLLSSLSL